MKNIITSLDNLGQATMRDLNSIYNYFFGSKEFDVMPPGFAPLEQQYMDYLETLRPQKVTDGGLIVTLPVKDATPTWTVLNPPALDVKGNGGIVPPPSSLKSWGNLLYSVNGKDGSDDELKNIYNSIKDAPKYPEGFESVSKRNVNVKDKELLEKLRNVESGTWKKVYNDGYDASGSEVSVHYFQSKSGKVFDVKVKNGWSNPN